MNAKFDPEKMVKRYEMYLFEQEKADETIKKYIHEINEFISYMKNNTRSDEQLDKKKMIEYRCSLQEMYKPQTVNGKLIAVNAFLFFCRLGHLRVKLLRIQKCNYIAEDRELSEAEYKRLLTAAKNRNKKRLYYIMQTICGLGIRVSELRFVTVENVKSGSIDIHLKGKFRKIMLPNRLRKNLLWYIRESGIKAGCVFRTKNGKPIDRSNIGHEMKKLCDSAGVSPGKVFPHNLRHLFARQFYAIEKNISHLADILGHSSIETTRIYLAVSFKDHERILNKMSLVI